MNNGPGNGVTSRVRGGIGAQHKASAAVVDGVYEPSRILASDRVAGTNVARDRHQPVVVAIAVEEDQRVAASIAPEQLSRLVRPRGLFATLEDNGSGRQIGHVSTGVRDVSPWTPGEPQLSDFALGLGTAAHDDLARLGRSDGRGGNGLSSGGRSGCEERGNNGRGDGHGGGVKQDDSGHRRRRDCRAHCRGDDRGHGRGRGRDGLRGGGSRDAGARREVRLHIGAVGREWERD